jgi:hypothetical protein
VLCVCSLSPIQSRHFRSPFFLLFDSFFLLLFSTEKRRVPLLPSGYYTLYSMPCEFKNLCDSLSSSFVYIIAQEKSRELDMWVLGKDKPTYFLRFSGEKSHAIAMCNKQNNLKNRQSLYIILYPFFPSERGSLTHLF